MFELIRGNKKIPVYVTSTEFNFDEKTAWDFAEFFSRACPVEWLDRADSLELIVGKWTDERWEGRLKIECILKDGDKVFRTYGFGWRFKEVLSEE